MKDNPPECHTQADLLDTISDIRYNKNSIQGGYCHGRKKEKSV